MAHLRRHGSSRVRQSTTGSADVAVSHSSGVSPSCSSKSSQSSALSSSSKTCFVEGTLHKNVPPACNARPTNTQFGCSCSDDRRQEDAQLRVSCEDTYLIGLAHDIPSKVLGTTLLEDFLHAAHVADVEWLIERRGVTLHLYKVTAWQLVTHGSHEFGRDVFQGSSAPTYTCKYRKKARADACVALWNGVKACTGARVMVQSAGQQHSLPSKISWKRIG